MLRQVHAGLAWLFVAAIVVQVWLAGAAIPQLGGNGSFVTHRDFGYLIGVFALALVLAAIAARAGRRRIGQAGGLLVCTSSSRCCRTWIPGCPSLRRCTR